MAASFDLAGRVALVTGAARGIGRALAIGLARAGADVIVLDRASTEAVAEEIRRIGRQAWPINQDLADSAGLPGLVDEAWRTAGRIDVLVNNAGMATIQRFNTISLALWRQVMAVNLDAPFLLSQRVAEHMIAAGIAGRIVNITSKNAFVAEAGLAHYDASKAALAMLTRTLAVELGPHRITVNSVAPGMIDTEIATEFLADAEEFRRYYSRHIPLGEYGTTDDCLGAVLLLASDAGRYITGQHIVVDGGVLAQQAPRDDFLPPYASSLEER